MSFYILGEDGETLLKANQQLHQIWIGMFGLHVAIGQTHVRCEGKTLRLIACFTGVASDPVAKDVWHFRVIWTKDDGTEKSLASFTFASREECEACYEAWKEDPEFGMAEIQRMKIVELRRQKLAYEQAIEVCDN